MWWLFVRSFFRDDVVCAGILFIVIIIMLYDEDEEYDDDDHYDDDNDNDVVENYIHILILNVNSKFSSLNSQGSYYVYYSIKVYTSLEGNM